MQARQAWLMADHSVTLQSIQCPLCPVSFHKLISVGEYTKHLRLFHASKPDFKITCGINGCQQAYTNLGIFKNHLYGIHSGAIDAMTVVAPESMHAAPESESPCCSGLNSTDCADARTTETTSSDHHDDNDVSDSTNNPETVCSGSLSCTSDAMQKSSALFLLGLKEKHKLTQVTVQSIVDNVTTLTQQRISSVKSQVAI